jgi:hypothetical protein
MDCMNASGKVVTIDDVDEMGGQVRICTSSPHEMSLLIIYISFSLSSPCHVVLDLHSCFCS